MAITTKISNGVEFTEVTGSVFHALFEPEQAADLIARSSLMNGLTDYIDRHGLTQTEAAERMGTSQPRISLLKRGQINEFTADSLLRMAARAGLTVSIALSEPEPA